MHSCIITNCKNEGRHLFPSDKTRRKQWMDAVANHIASHARKYSRLCSAHFQESDFSETPMLSLLSAYQRPDLARMTLKKTAIPSIFKCERIKERTPPMPTPKEVNSSFNRESNPKTYSRVPPIKHVEIPLQYTPLLNDEPQDPLLPSDCDNEDILSDKEDSCSSILLHYDDTNGNSIVEIEIQCNSSQNKKHLHEYTNNLDTEKQETSVQTSAQRAGFSIHNYTSNDVVIHFYTGLENFQKFMLAYRTLGDATQNLKYIYGSPPETIDILDCFFIALIILRRHTAMQEISMWYEIPIKQVYNIFITWIRFMSVQWKKIDLWVDKEIVQANMPLDFHDKYPNTRVLMDATECPVKKSKLPLAQQITFSTYKNQNTIKVLIGMAPSGMITFVSPSYGGSAPDRSLIERSSILERFNYNDEIMVDKGLRTQDIFIPYGVKVNMPAFFKKGSQISAETLSSNRKVASKRVHIERIIGMLKTYKILKSPMNLTEIKLSSDIVYICAMLVNFRTNIMNKNA